MDAMGKQLGPEYAAFMDSMQNLNEKEADAIGKLRWSLSTSSALSKERSATRRESSVVIEAIVIACSIRPTRSGKVTQCLRPRPLDSR